MVDKKKGWGRPKGSTMPESAKKKIGEATKARYLKWKQEQIDLENDKL